ncbi:MAG: hypothetical protein KGH66_01025 [Candidatus Micrarchaeota archaeon]|nr:hypothetical protein [Candidatus Micrarchaeota archaeon]
MSVRKSKKMVSMLADRFNLTPGQAGKAIEIYNDRYKGGVNDMMRGLGLTSDYGKAGSICDLLRSYNKPSKTKPAVAQASA